MAILSIKRDYGVNPSIVRMTTNDSYSTMTTAGYLTAQLPAFEQINGGAFQFVDSDMILCYYPAGFQFFTLNSTKTSLIAYTDTLPEFVASSVLATDQNSNPVWKGPLTNGQIIIGSTGAAPVASTLTAGTNVTITNSAGNVTISATGSGGGVNAGTSNQLAYYSSAGATVSGIGPGSAGQLFQSNGSGSAPAYTTATYPAIATGTGTLLRADGTNYVASTATFADTYAASTMLYSNGANTVTGLATANNGVLVTSNAGVPSWLANSGVPGYVLTANSGASPSWQPASSAGAVLLAPSNNQVITGAYTLSSNNLVQGYTSTPTSGGTTLLTVGSTHQQYFTGTTTQTVTLPVVSTLVLGFQFTIVNNSTGVITINSSGGNLVEAMDSLTQLVVTCVSTSGTTAASWDTDYTSDILPVPLADGGTNAALTASDGGVFYSTASSGAILAGTATANRVLLSGANSTPSWSTATYPITAGTNGNVLTSDGTNWVSSPPTSGSWVNQTTATVTMATNSGYTANAGASLITFTLPTSSAIGDFIEIVGVGSGLWTIAQAAGQQIQVAPNATTLGVGGSLSSINQYDSVRLRCVVANTTWAVVSQQSTGLTRV
jgi:hypothetical protein